MMLRTVRCAAALLALGGIMLVPLKSAGAESSVRLSALREDPPAGLEGLKENDPETRAKVLEPGLSLEQRRHFLYLYARLGEVDMAEELARLVLAEDPADRETLLTMAKMYHDLADAKKAMLYAEKLARHYPEDEETGYFLASANYLNKDFAQSFAVFEKLRRKWYQGKPYPYQNELALAAYRSGDWQAARDEYERVSSRDDLSPEVLRHAEDVLARIKREHQPQISVEQNLLLPDTGRIHRIRVRYQQHVHAKHRWSVEGAWKGTHIDESFGIREQSSGEFEARFGLLSQFNHEWTASLSLGGAESGLLGGVALTRSFGPQRELSLEFNGYERSQDGLFIETLLGRQHRLSLRGHSGIGSHWFAALDFHVRKVLIDHEDLGSGGGGIASIERRFNLLDGEMRTGYRLIWQDFSRDSSDIGLVDTLAEPSATDAFKLEILEGLIPSWAHRQGPFVGWAQTGKTGFYPFVLLGCDYDFPRSSFEYYVNGGLSWRFFQQVDLTVEGGYGSSATSSDLESGQSVFNINIKGYF